MRNFFLLFIIAFSCKSIDIIPDDSTQISVAYSIENYLLSKSLDSDHTLNGLVKYGDIKNVDSLDILALEPIKKLDGLAYFKELKVLIFRNFDNLSYVSNGIKYESKYYYFPLDTLDVSTNTELVSIDFSGYQLYAAGLAVGSIHYVKLGNQPKLKNIKGVCNFLDTIDLSEVPNIETINMRNAYNLSKIDLCKNNSIKELYITSRNHLSIKLPVDEKSIKWLPSGETSPFSIQSCN